MTQLNQVSPSTPVIYCEILNSEQIGTVAGSYDMNTAMDLAYYHVHNDYYNGGVLTLWDAGYIVVDGLPDSNGYEYDWDGGAGGEWAVFRDDYNGFLGIYRPDFK